MKKYKKRSTLLFPHILTPPGITYVIATLLCTLAADASNYYRHTRMATTGQAGLTGIKSAPSINDLGRVAFIGQISGGEGVFYADGQTPVNLSPSFSSRTFSTTVQINNLHNVVARDSGGSIFFVRLWRVASPDSPTVVDSTSGVRQSYCTGGFNAGNPCDSSANCPDLYVPGVFYPCVQPPQSHYIGLLFPTVNNNNETAYIGGITGTTSNAVAFLGRYGSPEYLLPSSFKTMRELLLADNGRIVARAGNSTTSPIWMFEPNLASYVEIASSASGFSELGEFPGISDDGSIVAFAGNRGSGRGAFISFVGLAGSRITLCVAGENATSPRAELGQIDANTKIYFNDVDPGSRVAVKSISPQANTLENAEVLITFVGTPNLAATDVQVGSSQTLTFSNTRGIWAIRGFLRRSGSELAFVRERIFPVIQIGDPVGPNGTLPVDNFSVYDPLATPTTTPVSLESHYIAFWATSGSAQMVVRSSATVLGIDVSLYSCGQDFAAAFQTARQNGKSFVIVQGWGGRSKNQCASDQLAAARAAGLDVAGYCLLNFASGIDGGCQVKKALAAFGAEAAHLKFLAIDVEDVYWPPNPQTPSAQQSAVDLISDAVAMIVRAGLRPVIYSNDSYDKWNERTGSSPAFSYLSLWLDRHLDPGLIGVADLPPVNFGAWTACFAKQYAIEIPFGGINVDLDIADGSLFFGPDPLYVFPAAPNVRWSLGQGLVTFYWCDEDAAYVLERSQSPSGPWTAVPSSANPYVIDVSAPTVTGSFFRLRSQ